MFSMNYFTGNTTANKGYSGLLLVPMVSHPSGCGDPWQAWGFDNTFPQVLGSADFNFFLVPSHSWVHIFVKRCLIFFFYWTQNIWTSRSGLLPWTIWTADTSRASGQRSSGCPLCSVWYETRKTEKCASSKRFLFRKSFVIFSGCGGSHRRIHIQGIQTMVFYWSNIADFC